MITRILHRLALFGLIALILASVITAVAAANTVPATRAYNQDLGARTADQLKPPECTMSLTNIVLCPASGVCSGTGGNDLILGSPNADNIQGDKGNDCILGGGGDDSLRGDQDTDVCIGGLGTDTFHSSCEIQIP